MTPAQEMYQRRLAALNQLKRSGGDGGGLLGLLAGGAPLDAAGPTSVPLDAEQGPAMGGGLLHKGPSAPAAAGRGITAPGKTHFFIKGRGPTIDFGPIFKPRSTGADPMQGDPFKATDGVGGFFRRLLGDNSDELNSEWQKMRMERSMNLSDKAEDRAAKAEELAATQGFTQGENVAQRNFTAAESAQDRMAREKLQESAFGHDKTMLDLNNEAGALRDSAKFNFESALADKRGGYDLAEAMARATPRGSQMKEAGKVYTDENGKEYSYYVGENDRLIRYNLDGSEVPTEQGAPDDNARNLVRQRVAALAADKEATELAKPATAMQGVGAIGENAINKLGSFFGPIVMPSLRDWYANKIKPTGDILRDAAEQRRREKIANFYE